jgi:SOS-response transcriptional repressor LexA
MPIVVDNLLLGKYKGEILYYYDMNIKERVTNYLETKGLSKYEFYKRTGLSNGFLDKGHSIGSDKCAIICEKFPDLSLEWLIKEGGEMIAKPINEQAHTVSTATDKQPIPLLTRNDLGGGLLLSIKKMERMNLEQYLVPEFSAATFIYRVQGNAMSPTYIAGDLIACTPLPLASFIQWGTAHLITTKGQGVILKRINPGSGIDHHKCISDNGSFETFDLPINEIVQISLVVGLIRAG